MNYHVRGQTKRAKRSNAAGIEEKRLAKVGRPHSGQVNPPPLPRYLGFGHLFLLRLFIFGGYD